MKLRQAARMTFKRLREVRAESSKPLVLDPGVIYMTTEQAELVRSRMGSLPDSVRIVDDSATTKTQDGAAG